MEEKHSFLYPEPKKLSVEREINSEVETALRRHIVDRDPSATGRQELVKSLGNAALGMREVNIDRSDPAISIESATLARGKSRVLTGPNGAGKSTLFDALMERDSAFVSTNNGRGAAVVGRSVHQRERLRIARLDQEELMQNIGEHTAADILENASRYFKMQLPINWDDARAYEANLKNQEAHTRIEALMGKITALFDMQEFLGTKVKSLSGGERTKLALFMVLSSEADALLLDEPTNHLDLGSISKLTALFDAYKKAGVSIISVSHVDWFLREAGKDGVMEIQWNRGGRKLIESSSVYEKYIKDASRERVPIISGDIEWLQQDYGYKQGEALVDSPPRFTVKNSPLVDVSAPNIHGGEVVMLSGNNGTGKTILMETMVRNESNFLPKRQKGVHIAHLPQFWPEQVTDGTIGDFFEWIKDSADPFARGSSLHPEGSARGLFIKIAGQLAFGGKSRFGETWLNRPLKKLSGGEQRLLWFIAVSALRSVDMLALDEPTNHMDRFSQEKVAKLIRAFPGAVLISTHDRNLIETLSVDSGTIRGAKRFPTHLVMEKNLGKTSMSISRQNPADYMRRVVEDAKRQARQLKL